MTQPDPKGSICLSSITLTAIHLHALILRRYVHAAASVVITMDKAFRRKLRRRTIRRFEKTRARLIDRGATRLLTLAQMRGKQRGMVARFRAHGVPEGDWQHLQRCRPGRCRCGGSAACWFADRTTANELNRAALRILRRTKKPLHYVTIIDPLYYRPLGELSTLSINGMMESLRRRFRLAGEVLKGDLAYGYIEIALEILPDGREFWSAHFHLVVASDATPDAIRDALRPPREMPDPESWHRLRWKPIKVKSVTNLANLLAYNGKLPPEANRITVENGKRDRKPDRLRSDRQLEFDLWLLDQKPSDRIFNRGMRVFRGKLAAVRSAA